MPAHIIGNRVLAVSRPDKRLNKFVQGGVINSFSMPKELTSIAPYSFVNIGGLTEIIFTNQEYVVNVSDNSGIGANVKFVVPSQLLSDYETAYPNRTIVSYESGYQWVIPYVSGETSTTLTSAYINQCLMENPNAKKAVHVVVPSYFTSYASGAFDTIFSSLTHLESIESPWLNGTKTNGIMLFIDGVGDISNEYLNGVFSKFGSASKSNISMFQFSAFFTWSSFKHVVWENKDMVFLEFARFDDVIYYGNANMKTVFSTYEVYDYARADNPSYSRAFQLTDSASSTCELCFELTLPSSTYDAGWQSGILSGRYPLSRRLDNNVASFLFSESAGDTTKSLGNPNVEGKNYLRFYPNKQYNNNDEYQFTAPTSSDISLASQPRALIWIRYMLLSDGNTLLRQLIPVKDNGQGKLLDLVSGNFFVGNTPFDLGND